MFGAINYNIIKQNKVLSLILLATFLSSFAYALYFKIQPKVDALAYDTISQNIVSGQGYRENVDRDVAHDNAIARVGPLYEYFLAGVYKIFGHHFFVVWFLQALLRVFSVLLLYNIGLIIFKNHEGRVALALWSSALFGLYPDLIESSAMLLTETLYIFLFILMLWGFFFLDNEQTEDQIFLLTDKRGSRSKSNLRSASQTIFFGLVSGLAVLARPPLLFCLPIILFYFYNKNLFKHLLLFILAVILVFTPWTVRNYDIYQKILPFGIVGQLNFWVGNHLGSRGEQEASPEIFEFSKTHTPVELGDESMKQFKKFVLEHPPEFLKITALRVNKYFSITRPMGFWFYSSGWRQMLFVVSSVLASIILFIFGLAGAIKMFREKNERYLYLLSFVAITPLILFITVVETRYRFQIYPLLSLSAGYFIGTFNFKDQQARRILLIAALAVFLNGGLDLLMNTDRLLERLGQWVKF